MGRVNSRELLDRLGEMAFVFLVVLKQKGALILELLNPFDQGFHTLCLFASIVLGFGLVLEPAESLLEPLVLLLEDADLVVLPLLQLLKPHHVHTGILLLPPSLTIALGVQCNLQPSCDLVLNMDQNIACTLHMLQSPELSLRQVAQLILKMSLFFPQQRQHLLDFFFEVVARWGLHILSEFRLLEISLIGDVAPH